MADMKKYTVIVARRADEMLLRHVSFLARVSVPAAQRFVEAFDDVKGRLEDNPYQFPYDTDPCLPADTYRKVIFAKRYKALCVVDDASKQIFLDAVVDCRQDPSNML